MGEKSINISLCAFTALLLIITTVGQALSQTALSSDSDNLDYSSLVRSGSVEVWQDDFHNVSKIDAGLSQHIVVNTTIGTVSMENTYPAWVDPSFSRMKQISVFNSGQETFHDYDINMTILYDTDMQVDFDDLRFTNGTGAQLPYYKLNTVNGVSCQVLVKIQTLSPGQSMIYMFYGNPSATNQSSFPSIFSWKDRTRPDTMVSFKAASEGAWDPDVIYGQNRFLVTWEERVGPEDINLPLPHYERTIPGVIHGRTYNSDGTNPNPTNNTDIDVSDPISTTYHAENPCNAFGAGNFFVVWEENPANQPLNRFKSDIKGALVTASGNVTLRFTICSTGTEYGQYDPQVAFDSMNNRFLVVWADARYGTSSYDIRGRLYNSLGYSIGPDFPIAYEINYQGNPWMCSDNEGHFFIVYEDGPNPSLGPFSLYAYRYDWQGNRLGSRITIAVGSDMVDYIFPAVSYNSKIQRYCVTWNDGDVSIDPLSRDSYNGNIWGKILGNTGGVIKNNYIIEPGTSFIRSTSVAYFDTMFFVAYDGTVLDYQDIYGRVIASSGTVMTNRQELSDGSSQNVDWNDIAEGAGRLFVTWEDERDLMSQYADVFQYVWRSSESLGSSNITYTVGSEKELLMQALLMSVPIKPEMFREWREFFSIKVIPSSCTIVFDILDQNATMVLKANVLNGQNISDINTSAVRLRGTFTRTSAHHTPVLDKWNISALVGKDIYAPSTTIMLSPEHPNGNNNWYITPVSANFTVVDVDTDPENITTYYNINGFGVQIYDPDFPPIISSERPNNYIEYWSYDSVNEELPHHRLEGIKIDTTAPMITLYTPSYIIPPGSATINGSGTEYTTGSGFDRVKIDVNEETIYETTFNGDVHVWFEWHFIADIGETYDIHVQLWDKAGNSIEERRTVLCPDHGMYDTGYIYWFNNPKIGPVRLLVSLGLSIAVSNNTLYVVLPGVISDAVSVKFVATQGFLKKEFIFWDTNLSDGCSANLLVPLGVYGIKAFAYDDANNQLAEYTIITKMLIFLVS
ncbi:MAG TPA: DUF2341 domain-containing protein [Candidatus Thermoplasmatota archaeon]|nr:DUF2341 domain-containing protein [Candidatus Thermoplasmatota archaeon]